MVDTPIRTCGIELGRLNYFLILQTSILSHSLSHALPLSLSLAPCLSLPLSVCLSVVPPPSFSSFPFHTLSFFQSRSSSHRPTSPHTLPWLPTPKAQPRLLPSHVKSESARRPCTRNLEDTQASKVGETLVPLTLIKPPHFSDEETKVQRTVDCLTVTYPACPRGTISSWASQLSTQCFHCAFLEADWKKLSGRPWNVP